MIVNKILNLTYDKVSNTYNRTRVGYISGIIGIFLNSILCVSKFIFGILTNSVAIMADAINNLSDVMSSFITIMGFKISSTPPDKDHPYGHGRVEYITTFIVSIIILFVGFQFIKTSITRILKPEAIIISKPSMIFLVLSILIKFWMSILNRKLGNQINSDLLIATSFDSLADCFTTSVVLISSIIVKYINFPIDGIVGTLISIYIVYSGYSIARDTVSYLIGKAPDDKLTMDVMEELKKYDMILGVHNLKFHTYGDRITMATVDVEVNANNSLVKVHNLTSVIEKEMMEKFNISLVIHAEPVGGEFTEREKELKIILDNYFKNIKYIKSIHDFAIYKTNSQNFVALEVVVDGNMLNKNFNELRLKKEIEKLILRYDSNLKVVIRILFEYI